jgi:uracil-DNA glycosylase
MNAPVTINPKIDPSWLAVLEDEFQEPHMADLKRFLMAERAAGHTVYPPGNEMFNAFNFTPFDQVRVVILGQDPYHGPGQAHGLCFSVKPPVPPPPSLRNIHKELQSDLGIPIPDHGSLEKWARQGVLLLNTTLSVRAGQAGSHVGQGWEDFTDRVIYELDERKDTLAFVLWGKNAQQKEPMISEYKHLIVKSPHPSPFSADRGFFGSRPFSRINTWFEERGEALIDWSL